MGKMIRGRIPEELQEKISDTINTYAVENGFENAADFTSKMKERLNSDVYATKSSAEQMVYKTIDELSPRIFIQLVKNFSGYETLAKQMSSDFWGYFTEGAGFEIFGGVQNAPQSTKILDGSEPFTPSKFTEQYTSNWSLKYVTDNRSTMTPEAYAFRQTLVIQKTMVLSQFRTGAGFEYLTMMLMNLYDSLLFTQYVKWASQKIEKYTKQDNPVINGHALNVNGTGTDAFECWNEIFTLIYKMTMVNSVFNFNGDFKRVSSVNLSDIVIYCSNKTRSILKHCIKSQLFNNAEFSSLLDQITIVVPNYKLKLRNATNAAIELNGESIQPNTLVDLPLAQDTIPDGFVWDSSDEEYIPDNKVLILTKESFIWIKQTNLEMDQEFANNFSKVKALYEMGAMDFRPDAKCAIYVSDNLNVNPASESTVTGTNP